MIILSIWLLVALAGAIIVPGTFNRRLSRIVMWLGWPVWMAFVAGCALVDTLEGEDD